MPDTPTLAAALLRVHSRLKNPAFDKVNPHFKSKYTSLAALRDAIHEIASAEGVFVEQDVTADDKSVSCRTIVTLGATGESRSFGPLTLPTGGGAQAFGSCTTYARRYSLQSAFNICGDDDEDGNTATASVPAKPAAKPPVAKPKPTKPEPPTPEPPAGTKEEQPPAAAPEVHPDTTRYQAAMKQILGCTTLSMLTKIAQAITARHAEGVFSDGQLEALDTAIERRDKTLRDAEAMDKEVGGETF